MNSPSNSPDVITASEVVSNEADLASPRSLLDASLSLSLSTSETKEYKAISFNSHPPSAPEKVKRQIYVTNNNVHFKEFTGGDNSTRQTATATASNSSVPREFVYDSNALPIQNNFENRFDMSIDDFGRIQHFCDGSHSHLFRGAFGQSAVVLKVIRESSVINASAKNEFCREISILSRLCHPNIIEFYGAGKVPSQKHAGLHRDFLAVEFLLGNTLTYYLNIKRPFTARPFSEARYMRIAIEFASALEYMHCHLHPDCILIHRDLKPDNMGFTASGTFKLIDFGLCITVKRSDKPTELNG